MEADRDRYLESSAVQPNRRSERFVFVSGQASVDATEAIISGTFEEEMRRSMANVESALASAGLTLRDVVWATRYVHDSADGPRYNEIYRDYFTAPLPTRTTISNLSAGAQVRDRRDRSATELAN